ncbi:MAG: zeta toxin family protein [Planctomycetaceae bacterium]
MNAKVRQPVAYVVAGPNGAGKTAFATEFLPDFVRCRNFLNADLIAAGLSPFDPESQNLRAGRLLLERIRESAADQQDFGFETTLSGRSYVKLMKELREQGYRIELFFLWLPTAEMAVSRVAERVRKGGHSIPEPVIRRRFKRGLHNLFHRYRSLVDDCWLFDGANFPPRPVAVWRNGTLTTFEVEILQRIQDPRND